MNAEKAADMAIRYANVVINVLDNQNRRYGNHPKFKPAMVGGWIRDGDDVKLASLPGEVFVAHPVLVRWMMMDAAKELRRK